MRLLLLFCLFFVLLFHSECASDQQQPLSTGEERSEEPPHVLKDIVAYISNPMTLRERVQNREIGPALLVLVSSGVLATLSLFASFHLETDTYTTATVLVSIFWGVSLLLHVLTKHSRLLSPAPTFMFILELAELSLMMAFLVLYASCHLGIIKSTVWDETPDFKAAIIRTLLISALLCFVLPASIDWFFLSKVADNIMLYMAIVLAIDTVLAGTTLGDILSRRYGTKPPAHLYPLI